MALLMIALLIKKLFINWQEGCNMKNLNSFIYENLTKVQGELLGRSINNMFIQTKISKEQISLMLNNLEKEAIMAISDYIFKNDNKNALAYTPDKDMFIDWDANKQNICMMIAEYLNKYVSNQ